MAEFYFQPPAAPRVNFITKNPALDEYYRAQQQAREQETADTNNALARERLTEAKQQAPTRLRLLGAQANEAEAGAQIQGDTAKVTPQLLTQKLDEGRAKITAMSTANAMNLIKGRQQIFAALDAGNVDLAKQTAAQLGVPLTPDLINNAQLRAWYEQISKQGAELYPNPLDSKKRLMWEYGQKSEKFKQAAETALHGQSMPNPQQGVDVSNAPEPTHMPLKAGETQQIMAWIQAAHPDWPPEKVVQASHGREGELAMQQERLVQSAATKDPDYASDPTATLQKYRQYYGFGKPAGEGGPGGAQQQVAPPRPQSIPPGSAYSPSRKMWRDPQGNLYDANGQRIGSAAPPQPQQPQVPFSTQ